MTPRETKVEGFPFSARMHNRRDFLRCQSSGVRYSGRHVLLVCADNDRERDRLGVVVTKKTGNAVVRNRWKRCIRDCFRKLPNRSRGKRDCVVTVKRSVQGPPPAQVAREFRELFEKAEK